MNHTPHPASEQDGLTPDYDEIRRFLGILNPTPGARFGWRFIHDRDTDAHGTVLSNGTLEHAIRQSGPKKGQTDCPARLGKYLQRLGYGWFVQVQEPDGVGQSLRNIVRCWNLIGDCDTAEQVGRAERVMRAIPATMVVASGGTDRGVSKLHCYWRIPDMPLAAYDATQALMQSRLGADPAAVDMARVLRAAGSWHLKSEPRPVRIITADPAIQYGYTDIIARLRALPEISEIKVTAHRGPRRSGTTGGHDGAPAGRLTELIRGSGGLLTVPFKRLLSEMTIGGGGTAGNAHLTMRAVLARGSGEGWSRAEIAALVRAEIVLRVDAGTLTEAGAKDLARRFASIAGWIEAGGRQREAWQALGPMPAHLAGRAGQ